MQMLRQAPKPTGWECKINVMRRCAIMRAAMQENAGQGILGRRVGLLSGQGPVSPILQPYLPR